MKRKRDGESNQSIPKDATVVLEIFVASGWGGGSQFGDLPKVLGDPPMTRDLARINDGYIKLYKELLSSDPAQLTKYFGNRVLVTAYTRSPKSIIPFEEWVEFFVKDYDCSEHLVVRRVSPQVGYIKSIMNDPLIDNDEKVRRVNEILSISPPVIELHNNPQDMSYCPDELVPNKRKKV